MSKTAKKVFEMMDNIVEEVGEDNVIQVVIDNVAKYKVPGQMLMTEKKVILDMCNTLCGLNVGGL